MDKSVERFYFDILLRDKYPFQPPIITTRTTVSPIANNNDCIFSELFLKLCSNYFFLVLHTNLSRWTWLVIWNNTKNCIKKGWRIEGKRIWGYFWSRNGGRVASFNELVRPYQVHPKFHSEVSRRDGFKERQGIRWTSYWNDWQVLPGAQLRLPVNLDAKSVV